MKKRICLLLSIVFLLSCMPLAALAQETEGGETVSEELTNVAHNDSALAYASGEKNSLWTPAYALIDGAKSSNTWQGWECVYPDIIYGSDTSAGFSGQYCGVKFTNKEYYEIYEMNFNVGLHAAMGGQNAHYLVQCLVEGVWVTVAEFSDSDTTPVVTDSEGELLYSSYEEAMEKDTSFYHIGSQYSVTLAQPITTNNVRVTLSNYAKNYPGGDVLIFPYIYEIELIGKLGVTPDLELPEGAVVSTNIGYHSYPEASSSTSYRYPYCAIDGKATTYWSPKTRAAGEYLSLVFSEPKKINKAVLNFGTYLDGMTITDYKLDIEALVDGAWVRVASGTSFDEENLSLITEYTFEEIETAALRVVFTEEFKKAPTVYEFEAHMSADKTYYVEDRFDVNQRSSASKGNIAIIGTPYANLDFAPYSDINYIIDGKAETDSYVWFTGVIDMPAYCGIKFYEKQIVDSVALYFDIPDIEGTDIMSIQIQALIDGEYVTLVNTKSYHEELKYSPAFKFDPVETDDIRILYTAGNGTFAHLKELEVYSPNGSLPMFDGLTAMSDKPVFIDCTTSEKAEAVKETNTQSNVEIPKAEHMNFVMQNDTQDDVSEMEAVPATQELTEDNSALLASCLSVGVVIGVMLVASIVFAFVKRRKFK